MGTKIKLPKSDEQGKPYVSYSQLSKFRENRSDYFKNYFFGERFEGNAYTEFGTTVGEALENNDFKGFNTKEKKFLETIPRLDEFERKIELDFGDYYVVGYIDSNDSKCRKLIDYKTGDLGKVSKYDSDVYDQIQIYALAIEQETGTLPKEGSVILVERTGNAFKGEKLRLGTEYVEIPQDFSKEALDKVKSDIVKTVEDISDYWKAYRLLTKT